MIIFLFISLFSCASLYPSAYPSAAGQTLKRPPSTSDLIRDEEHTYQFNAKGKIISSHPLPDACLFCLEPFTGEECPIHLSCGHFFHKKCLRQSKTHSLLCCAFHHCNQNAQNNGKVPYEKTLTKKERKRLKSKLKKQYRRSRSKSPAEDAKGTQPSLLSTLVITPQEQTPETE